MSPYPSGLYECITIRITYGGIVSRSIKGLSAPTAPSTEQPPLSMTWKCNHENLAEETMLLVVMVLWFFPPSPYLLNVFLPMTIFRLSLIVTDTRLTEGWNIVSLLFPVCYVSGYIGGYTGSALFNLTRSKELLLRWAEYAAFTPLMRTHEGNQPAANHQGSGASHNSKKDRFF